MIIAAGLQAICAIYFMVDVIFDLRGNDVSPDGIYHIYGELLVFIGLALGLVLGWTAVHTMLAQENRLELQIQVAKGAFQDVLMLRFGQWGLTPAESDVALFAIKGLSISEIAELRGKSEGTVKAQSNAIYTKAGVSSRSQLLGLFVEDLLDEPLVK